MSVCSVGRAVAAGVIDAKTGSMRRGTTGRVSWRLGGAGAESESERSRSTECEARRTGEKEEKKRGKKRKKEKKKTGKKQVGGCRGRSTRRTESEEVRVTRGVAESAATPSGDDRRTTDRRGRCVWRAVDGTAGAGGPDDRRGARDRVHVTRLWRCARDARMRRPRDARKKRRDCST